MKKLQKDIFTKTMFIILALFVLLFVISYALSKHFILSLTLGDTQAIEQTIESFNLVWLKISLLFFTLFVGAGLSMKYLQKKIYDDVESIAEYIYEISENKNYEKSMKIQHYLEFLHIAVGLKNIAKRLSQKDKKQSKK